MVVADRHFSSAWGRSKKEAEQKAAFNAVVELGILNGTLPNDNDENAGESEEAGGQ